MTDFRELESAFARFRAKHGRHEAEQVLLRIAGVDRPRDVSRQHLGNVIRALAMDAPPR